MVTKKKLNSSYELCTYCVCVYVCYVMSCCDHRAVMFLGGTTVTLCCDKGPVVRCNNQATIHNTCYSH